jgi:probable phosphoglycerate mutase
MTITTFLAVRHAEARSNAEGYFAGHTDVPLTERGVEQAQALSVALAQTRIDAMYCSDLGRARSTIEPLRAALGLAWELTPALRERDMGSLAGMTFERVRAELPDAWTALVSRDATTRPPGGESHADVLARVGAMLDGLVSRHRGSTVLLGSHGVAIQHIVRWLLGITDPTAPAFSMLVDNASVTRVDLQDLGSGVIVRRLVFANRVVPSDEPPFG